MAFNVARNAHYFFADSFLLLSRKIARKISDLSCRFFCCYSHQRPRLGVYAVSTSQLAKTLELFSRFCDFNSDFPTCFAFTFHREPRKWSWYAFRCYWIQFLPACILWSLVYLFILSKRSRKACLAKQPFWCFEQAFRTWNAFCFHWVLPASSSIHIFCLRCSFTVR